MPAEKTVAKPLVKSLPLPVKIWGRRVLKKTRERITTLLDKDLKLPDNPADHSLDELILNAARENLIRAYTDAQLPVPNPGSRWGGYATWIRKNIQEFETVAEATSFAQNQVGFEMRAMPPQASIMVNAQLEDMRSSYPEYAQALATNGESLLSDISHPGPVVIVDGMRYTTSQLSVVEHMFYIAKRLGKLPESVLEIGGGYGVPARAWLTSDLGRMRRFAILDLPESLFFSEVFLKAHFGIESVVNLADPRALSHAGKASVILCPVQKMSLLTEFDFDVAINTGSMQEMTDDWIAVYMDLLTQLKADYFYSANYFLQPIDRMNESMNLWSPRVPPQWALLDFDFYPASEESDFRNSLRAFYRREPPREFSFQNTVEMLDRLECRVANTVLTQEEGSELALLMDGFRREMPAPLVGRLARTLHNKFPLKYKELLFIVNWLLARRDELSAQDVTAFETLRADLSRLRAKGNEGLV